jgi:hypothetical protein
MIFLRRILVEIKHISFLESEFIFTIPHLLLTLQFVLQIKDKCNAAETDSSPLVVQKSKLRGTGIHM